MPPRTRPLPTSAPIVATVAIVGLLAACAAPPEPAEVRTSGALAATETGRLSFAPHRAERVALTDGLCFVACGEGGVRIVDVTDPSAPELLATIDDLRADAVAFAEDQLFVVGVQTGLFSDRATLTAIDVVDPRLPGVRRTTTFAVDGDGTSLSAEGATAAVAAGADGAVVVTGRSLEPEALDESLSEGRTGAALVRRGACWFLLRDNGTASIVRRDADGTWSRCDWTEASGSAGPRGADLELSGDVLLAATGAELRLVDVGDPGAARPIGALPLPGATALAASGAVGAVVSADGQVVVLDLDRPERPTPAAVISPATAADVALLDGLLAVADAEFGLRLFVVERSEG